MDTGMGQNQNKVHILKYSAGCEANWLEKAKTYAMHQEIILAVR